MYKKFDFLIIVSLIVCLTGAVPLGSFAATTGKISGRIVDSKTGAALPGANVMISGTTTGAAADLDGRYFIINIRPGSYRLEVRMMGCETKQITNVDVNAGHTTKIDINLNPTIIAGEAVTVVAKRPIVQMDVSNTQTTIGPEKILEAPYHSIANIASARVGISGFGTMSSKPQIRGSDYRDGNIVVDGLALVDEISNRPFLTLNLNAIQEVQIITGGFNAEFGNNRSGLINVVTKEGQTRYTGSVDFKYSPPGLKHFGPMIYGKDSPIVRSFIDSEWGAWSGTKPDGSESQFFEGWHEYSTTRLKEGDPHYGSPYENLALYLWRHRSKDNLKLLQQLVKEGKVNADLSHIDFDEDAVFDYGNKPDYMQSYTFGGPVPFLKGVRFFIGHQAEKTAYARTMPSPFFRDQMTSLKLTTNITSSMKLNLNFVYGWEQGTNQGQGGGTNIDITNNPFGTNGAGFFDDVYRRMASANKMWYPSCNVPQEQKRYAAGFQFTHVLSPSTFYDVTFSHMFTEEDYVSKYRNTIKIEDDKWGGSQLRYGRLGTDDQIAAHIAAGDYDWENADDYKKIKIGDYWYDEAPWNFDPSRWLDVAGWYRMGSCNFRLNNSYNRYYTLKATITSQVNQVNQVKAGIELKHNRIHGAVYDFDPSVNGGDNTFTKGKPWMIGAFIQDKLEFEGMIANVGVRFEASLRDKGIFHFDDEWIKDDGRLDSDAYNENNSPYTLYLQAGYQDSLNELLNWQKVNKVRIMPRLGVSHPISNNSKIIFNYGHYYKWPSESDLYYYRQQITWGYQIRWRGNPDLAPPRTIQYEVGYTHSLFDRLRLSATGYYKDINDEITEVRFYPLDGREYRMNINNQYRDIRGIELMAEMRYGRFISGFTSLDYMISSRGGWGYDRFYEDRNKAPRKVESDVTQPVARPVFKLNVDLHTPSEFGPDIAGVFPLADFNFNILYTWRQGETFTWNPDGIPYVENNIRWRPYQRTDIRFRKLLFRKWNIESIFYIDVKNLFNTKNMNYPRGYQYNNSVNSVLTGVQSTWAWNDHRWWKNEFVEYMNSLDLTVDANGKISSPDRPGDYPENWPNHATKGGKQNYIDMPGFTPWTFLEKRDIFFGIQINF